MRSPDGTSAPTSAADRAAIFTERVKAVRPSTSMRTGTTSARSHELVTVAVTWAAVPRGATTTLVMPTLRSPLPTGSRRVPGGSCAIARPSSPPSEISTTSAERSGRSRLRARAPVPAASKGPSPARSSPSAAPAWLACSPEATMRAGAPVAMIDTVTSPPTSSMSRSAMRRTSSTRFARASVAPIDAEVSANTMSCSAERRPLSRPGPASAAQMPATTSSCNTRGIVHRSRCQGLVATAGRSMRSHPSTDDTTSCTRRDRRMCSATTGTVASRPHSAAGWANVIGSPRHRAAAARRCRSDRPTRRSRATVRRGGRPGPPWRRAARRGDGGRPPPRRG